MSDACISFFSCDHFKEHYSVHIESALIVWDRIRRYYLRGIVRAFGKTSFDVIALALSLHDIGKLTKAYSEGKRFYRHEIFSAYATYSILRDLVGENDLVYATATAVMLHHEPIIMKAYVGEYGEKYLTISNLKRVIEKLTENSGSSNLLRPNCDVKTTMEHVTNLLIRSGYADHSIKEAVMRFIDNWIKGVNGEELFKTLKEIIAWSSVMGDPDTLLIRRAKVALLLHPLVVSDSLAANIIRGKGCGGYEVDEGTFITRRALDGAEFITDELIQVIENLLK